MEPVKGKCHICEEVKDEIKFCPHCAHWFCKECRNNWFWRGIEAVKEKIQGRRPGCCGPEEK